MNNFLLKKEVPITNKIKIMIPTLREVFEDPDNYLGTVQLITAMPIDLMVQLDDMGIDFTKINEYDLFRIVFPVIATKDTSLIFGDLDLKKFSSGENAETGEPLFYDEENQIIIDRGVYEEIANTLRKINNLKKDIRKPGNKEARDYMIERARKKMKRKKAGKYEDSADVMETLLVALINTEQFKYNFETVQDLTIYQFNECVSQIINKVDYDNRMIGIYTGNLDSKKVNPDELNWLVHKK